MESNPKEIRRSFLNLARDELSLKPYVVQLLEDHEIDWDIARDLTHADLLQMGVKEIGTLLRILKWIKGKFSNGISMAAPAAPHRAVTPAKGAANSTSSSSSSSSSTSSAVLPSASSTSTVIVAHTSDVSPQAALIQLAQSSPEKANHFSPLNPLGSQGYFKPFHPPATRTVLASREQPSATRPNHHHHHHHQGQNGQNRRHSTSPAPKTDTGDIPESLELGVRRRKSERVMDEAKELLGDEAYQKLVMGQGTKRERIHTSSCIMACFGDPSSLKFNKSINSLEGYRSYLEKQEFEQFSSVCKTLEIFAEHKRGRINLINLYLSQIVARREERNEDNFDEDDLDDEDYQQRQPRSQRGEGEGAAEPKKRGRKRKNRDPAPTSAKEGEEAEAEGAKKDPTKNQENGEDSSTDEDEEGKAEGKVEGKEKTGETEPAAETSAPLPPKKKTRLSFDKKLASEARALQEAPAIQPAGLLSQEEIKLEEPASSLPATPMPLEEPE